MLKNTEGAVKKGQSRETGNIGYTRRRKYNKDTTQYVLDTTILKQTQITFIRARKFYSKFLHKNECILLQNFTFQSLNEQIDQECDAML